MQKTKILKFGTKNALFACFLGRILKYYCHIWNQHPQICPTAKFGAKSKIFKFRTKNAYLGIFELEFDNSILSEESGEKVKILEFGTENDWFGPFWTGISPAQ